MAVKVALSERERENTRQVALQEAYESMQDCQGPLIEGDGCKAAVGEKCPGYFKAGGRALQCEMNGMQCLSKAVCKEMDVTSRPSKVWSTTGNSWLIYTTRVTDPGYKEIATNSPFTEVWQQLTGGSMAIQLMFRKSDSSCGSTMVLHSYCEKANFNGESPVPGTSNRRRSAGTNKCQGGSATPNDGNWHRVVMNAKARSDKKQDYVIYIDGVLHKSGTTDDALTVAADGQLCFGGGHLDRTTNFELSKIAIWNRELGPDEITGAHGKCISSSSGLVAYYPLDGDLDDALGGRALDPGYAEKSGARDLRGAFVAPSSNYPAC